MTNKPKALDLFCGAGGASMGLHQAGFDVTGVDKMPQKNYPFKFINADALTFDLAGFDFIWASPPCQFASVLTPVEHRAKHSNLIPAIRKRLEESVKPFIIENVEGAKTYLNDPVKLCGSMFGLEIYRHRYFESNALPSFDLPLCNHNFYPVVVSGHSRRKVNGKRIAKTNARQRCDALGIDWYINREEASQAIPPKYSKFLGEQILRKIS